LVDSPVVIIHITNFSYLVRLKMKANAVNNTSLTSSNYTETTTTSLIGRWCLLLACFFFQTIVYAQLPDFTLTVTPTDETCLGNGALTFSVSGTNPNATIIYTVYQLPNTSTPIAVQNEPFLGGRTSGDYLVVAHQILGDEETTESETVTISSNIVPLEYTISSTNSVCADGTMTVTVTQGIGAQYEIISGPVIRPLQSSPLFTQLPGGVYVVRAFNVCGDGTVITHTVISDAAQIDIAPPVFPNRQLTACDLIVASNTLTSGDNVIAYPLTLNYTVYFPNGTISQTYTVNVPSGSADEYVAQIEIPFYYDQVYYYDLTVTDGCGNVFTRNDNLVNAKLTALLTAQAAECGDKYLTLTAACYLPNISVEFLEAPAGFVPQDFNATHPGPFTEDGIDYGGYTQPVPYGHYVVKITDGCGHTATTDATLTDLPIEPEKEVTPYPGCLGNMSLVKIMIPGFTIVNAVITAAPAAYPFPLDDDVSDQITLEDGLVLPNLIEGTYTVGLTDDCGNFYPYTFIVPPLDTYISATSWPACELGFGSIRISGSSITLLSVILTAAPVGFSGTLPYDVSFNIGVSGVFSMTGLIPGSYTFEVADSCGLQNTAVLNVIGYEVTANDFAISPHCGSFDLNLTHVANGIQQSYWLQRFDTVTNTWGHPDTGVPYTEGSAPNALNSYGIEANEMMLNLEFTGTFRVIKRFQTMDNGSAGSFRDCIEILGEFEFTGEVEFTGVEKLTCNGETTDVRVFAIGAAPLLYSITTKNNLPFFIDNGTDNLFTGLEPAIYTFTVEQFCGDSKNFVIDVAQLPSLATAGQPDDMSACDDVSRDGVEVFVLTDQDAAVLGAQNAADFTITYHATMDDAANGINPLPANYSSGNATIYCRLDYNGSADCYDLVSFKLIVNPYPVLEMALTWGICQGSTTIITADAGLVSYLWSTGETTQSIFVSQPGQYTLQITKAYPTGNCTGIYTIDVIPSNAPVIQNIEMTDWSDDENSITVVLDESGVGSYLYSLDNVNFQESNVFEGLNTGPYTIYVKDIAECGFDTGDAYLLNYPKYFTPNSDGIHDFWRIKFSEVEPHLLTYVYDRYGKLITGFRPESPGWDGTLNGEPLPSTDYWFVVIREDGKMHRGHFAMKR
jgi:gliding motility-associated-like protein